MGDVINFPRKPVRDAQDDASPMDVGQNVETRSADRRSPGATRARNWALFYAGLSLAVGWWPLTVWFVIVATVAHQRRPKYDPAILDRTSARYAHTRADPSA